MIACINDKQTYTLIRKETHECNGYEKAMFFQLIGYCFIVSFMSIMTMPVLIFHSNYVDVFDYHDYIAN